MLVERSDGVPSRRPRRGDEEKLEVLLLGESPRFRPKPLRRDPKVVGEVERLGSLDKEDEDAPRRPEPHDPVIERLDGIPSRRRPADAERLEVMLAEAPRLPLRPLRRDSSDVGDVERLGRLDNDDNDPRRRDRDAVDRSHDIPSCRCRRPAEQERLEVVLAASPCLPLKPLRRDPCVVGEVERVESRDKFDSDPRRRDKEAVDRSHDNLSRRCHRPAEEERLEAMLTSSPRLPLKPLRRDPCGVGDLERLSSWDKGDDEYPCRREKDAVD